MAEVYVAKTKGIGGFEKLVAIKVIHPRFSEDEHFIQMLVEEAKISVQLSHVNIAQTFDLGCIDDTYYIAMEFIEGADTYRVGKRALDKVEKLPIDICCYVGAEICHGLGYAHRKRDTDGNPLGIVHRDISPQNVLISHAGEVKLVDFGIAKAALRTGQTEVGVIKGKYYYMSPEQAWGDPVDQRSDVFSTGLLLHELLTGEMVYTENNVPALLDLVRKAEIKGPRAKRPEVPEELDRVILRACAKEPADRYQSAHSLAQDLTEILYRRNPTFTAAKLGDLMAVLFPDVTKRPSQVTKLPTEPPTTDERTVDPPPPSTNVEQLLESMSRDEFTPAVESSVIFDLDDLEDMTRNDILPFVRRTSSVEKAAPGQVTDVRETRQLLASAHGDPTSTARTMSRGDEWEEETFLKNRTQWDESTLVDDEGHAMASAHRLMGAARREPASGELKGEATVASASPFMPPPSRKPASMPPPARLPTKPTAAPVRPPPPPRPMPKAPSRPPPGRIPAARPPAAPPPWAGAAAPAMHAQAMGGPVAELAPVPTDAGPTPSELVAEKTTALADIEQIQHRPYRESGPSAGGIRLGPQADRFFQGNPAGLPSHPPAAPPHAPAPARTSGSFVPPPPHDPFAPPPIVTGPNEAQLGKPQPLKWLLLGGAVAFLVLAVIGLAIFLVSGPEPSTVEILSVPEGARVTVDGSPSSGVTPVHIEDVEPGQRMHVEIRLDGYEPRSEDLVIEEGENRRLIVLNPAQVTMRIETVPSGAQIWIDEVHRGNSPLDISLTAGQAVQLRARVAGRPAIDQRVTASPNETQQTLRLTFPPAQ